MQSLVTFFSELDLSSRTSYQPLVEDCNQPVEAQKLLPNYIVNRDISWYICHFLSPRELLTVSRCNKSFRALALSNSLWLPFVARSEPLFNRETPLYKHYLFQQQIETNAHKSKYKQIHHICAFQAYRERPSPGKKCPQTIFSDGRMIYHLKATGKLALFSLGQHRLVDVLTIQELKTSRRKKLPHAICSVRDGKQLIIRSEVQQTTETRLSSYNLATNEKTWQGQLGEAYLDSGGLNLGIGFLTGNEVLRWNRNLSLRRHSTYDETTSKHFATVQKLGKQYKVCQYEVDRPTAVCSLHFPEDEQPISCDLSASGNFSVITTCRNGQHYEHKIAQKGQLLDQEVEVLAFDPSLERMIIRSKRPEDCKNPLFYIDHIMQRRALQIPLSPRCYAQLRQEKACVLVETNNKRSLFLINLKDPLLLPLCVDFSGIKPFDLAYFTLFDDFIVACCFNPQDANQHTTVLIDAESGRFLRELVPTALHILGREGNVLIVEIRESVYSLDLKTSKVALIKKVADGSAFYSAHTLFFISEIFLEFDQLSIHSLTFSPKISPHLL